MGCVPARGLSAPLAVCIPTVSAAQSRHARRRETRIVAVLDTFAAPDTATQSIPGPPVTADPCGCRYGGKTWRMCPGHRVEHDERHLRAQREKDNAELVGRYTLGATEPELVSSTEKGIA